MPADRLEEFVLLGSAPSVDYSAEVPARSSRYGLLTELGARHLASLQKADGHWVAELEGDCILESEYILLLSLIHI